jgi:methionyl-tRNA formyltransferase
MMSGDPCFHVAAAGLKGLSFLTDLHQLGHTPARVFSYAQKDDHSEAFAKIVAFCEARSVALTELRRPAVEPGIRTFFVGWQYLIEAPTDDVVVFHDSLLPDLRGFAPTATALIMGRPRIGVTALQPDQGVDTGPVFLQDGFEVEHPMRIADALNRQAALMAALAGRILAADAASAPIKPVPQNDDGAIYSIWRDALDFGLDPAMPAEEIVRRVYALGHPYKGATIRCGDETLTVLDAIEVDEMNFAIRDTGKVWALDQDGPVVICGRGMVKFTDLRDSSGARWSPSRLRLRFERP